MGSITGVKGCIDARWIPQRYKGKFGEVCTLCVLPGMLGFLLRFPGDGSKRLFILLDGFPEGVEQRFRIDRVTDNPGMELGPPIFGIVLAKIEYKLKGVVADLEVVSISPFEPAGLLRVLICMQHQD